MSERNIPPLRYPVDLPITDRRDVIVRAIRDHQVVVVTGDTGSGKSTQIPKMCLEAGRGRAGFIGITQPRRIAAVTLARRVAEELGEEGAFLVGYKIRFQDRTSRTTRIKFMTDGILLAEAQRDRLFRAYDTLIVDEAHERSLNIDFLLGMLRRTLPQRPDLKVIVTSATIDPERFSEAFGGAPIIEVSGRTYPVEVRYRPPAPGGGEEGGDTPVDQAVEAVVELKRCGCRGDVLVFMPTESDIRETVARLEERRFPHTEVLPLFGRLAGADQQRIFRPVSGEKIVVATNVAETSITIPGIRYVVDTGLARLSQYNPRTRTEGLPVVSISRASADQRKGRCGRVGPGICIRLYAEEDYQARPAFTPPEIQRSNLAEVILRMLAMNLGDVRDFPFLDPPAPQAVKDGFAVLRELGAIDDRERLTPMGRLMARFPLDPRLSRMLLQAREEGALRPMIVLCAALSVQDPRERPAEKEAQADQAHAAFRDRRSDFVTLLNIWRACEDQWRQAPSQGALRRFCKDNFLSYRRVREWRDVHDEIVEILKEIRGFRLQDEPPGVSYEAVHRAVTSGFLSNIAVKKEKNLYLGTKGRKVMLFPGSGLFNRGGEWIVAAELVQTSRLFARTAAQVQPEWIEEFGKHLCRSSYEEPHWEKRRGQVVALERVTLYGLVIVNGRRVNYGRIRPKEAREIFIRSGLVEGEMPGKYGFLEHNRKLIQRIRDMEDRIRRRELLVDDEALYAFYDARLPEIADIRSFNRWLKDQGGDEVLRMSEDDLLRFRPESETLEQFPGSLDFEDMRLPLRYSFSPGDESDGVTVTVPLHLLSRLRPEPFEWVVPGLISEKVTALLRSLPKSVRRRLVPIPETVEKVLERLPFRRGDFYAELSRCLEEVSRVAVSVNEWDREGLPAHLKMRFLVVDADGKALGSGRDLETVQELAGKRHEDRAWTEARKRWERDGITTWDFGPLPQTIELGKDAYGVMRCAYPGFVAEGRTVAVRLFDDPEKAKGATRDGLLVLYQLAFAPLLKSLRKDWVFPKDMAFVVRFMGDMKEADRRLQIYLLREIFELHDPQPPDEARFRAKILEPKDDLGRLAEQRRGEVLEVVRERYEVQRVLSGFNAKAQGNDAALERLKAVREELERLVPGDFLEHMRSSELRELPRYLKGLRIRAERAYVAPEKDRSKAARIEPFLEALSRAEAGGEAKTVQARAFLDEYRLLLEEFKISLFAPEIKTRFPVSAQRLEKKWRQWERIPH